MILPIVAYGDPILKRKAKTIDNKQQLEEVIDNMWETMYNANGIGLAAPQIGESIRLFIVDTVQIEDEEGKFSDGVKKVFINPIILDYGDEEDKMEEGCLSIPEINADVTRPTKIRITYFDEDWNEQEEEFDDFNARVIQHEYDHVEGILFTDRLSQLKKRTLKGKLDKIAKGNISPKYKMRFSKSKV